MIILIAGAILFRSVVPTNGGRLSRFLYCKGTSIPSADGPTLSTSAYRSNFRLSYKTPIPPFSPLLPPSPPFSPLQRSQSMLRIETFMFIGWLNFSQFLLIQPRDYVVQTMLIYRRCHPYIMPRVFYNEASIFFLLVSLNI